MPQRLSDVPLSQLVPETQRWNDGNGIGLCEWINCIGSIEHLIGYGELLWPDFVEFDGCILFAGVDESNYRGFMSQAGGDRRSVEAVMNHSHIVDMFVNSDSAPTRDQVVYVGRLLREIWGTKLRNDFPQKSIVVSFHEEGVEDPRDYVITFCQVER